MRFARWVFLLAGISGLLIIAPLYLEARFFADDPPAINRPEFYYGFAGVTLAWQLAFLVIAHDPPRYRLLMLPALVEKGSFVLAVLVLVAQERIATKWLAAALMDGTWFVLFALAFWWTPSPVPAPLPAGEKAV